MCSQGSIMSYEEEVSTLFTKDLDTTRESEIISSENIREIINENKALRNTVSLLLLNTSLRLAKLMGEFTIKMDSVNEKFQFSK